MLMTDFEFNGELLSDHNMIIGSLSTSDDPTPLGSVMTMNTQNVRNIQRVTSTTYQDVITKSFGIVRNTCYRDTDNFFTDEEIYEISTWLQPNDYQRFKPIYDDSSFADIYFMGRFNVEAVRIGAGIVGFNLTFTANAPYGFGEEQNNTYTITNSEDGNIFRVFNDSQEYGYLYFNKFEITCGSDGDFRMVNNNDISTETGQAYTTVIENCIQGEVITIDCENKIIQSSEEHDRLYNDFDYNFPRLVCDYNAPLNVFEVDTDDMSSATISVAFSPIRKVGVI